MHVVYNKVQILHPLVAYTSCPGYELIGRPTADLLLNTIEDQKSLHPWLLNARHVQPSTISTSTFCIYLSQVPIDWKTDSRLNTIDAFGKDFLQPILYLLLHVSILILSPFFVSAFSI